MTRFWIAGLLLLTAGASATAIAADEAASEAVAEDRTPVVISLPGLDGNAVSTADYRGQWVLLNYWATWCAPCRKEIPELSELHDGRDDVTVLGLAFEENDVAAFEAFLQDYPATYPILLVDVYDPPAPFGAPRALPTTIILNPEGVEARTFYGPVTLHQLEDVLAELQEGFAAQ